MGDVAIRLTNKAERPPEPLRWVFQSNLPDGQPWLSAARLDGGFLLRYADFADFVINRDGSQIALCHSDPASSPQTIHHLLLDQALPMVLSLRGIPALHAAAVMTSAGVCGFLGPAGTGKSTLAASFSLAGNPSLGDDCLAVKEEEGRFFAVPAYPGLRLWTDSAALLSGDWSEAPSVAHYTLKRRVSDARMWDNLPMEPEPLVALYRVERNESEDDRAPASTPAIENLRPNEAFMEVLSSSFVLDVDDRAVVTRHARFIERLLAGVPVRRLRVPNRYSSLPAVQQAVLHDLVQG